MIIDLSHSIHQDISVYDISERPEVVPCASHDSHGYAEKRLSLFSHTGTHIDAPFHILPNGKKLNDFPLDHFTGQAIRMDCSRAGQRIEKDSFVPHAAELEKADFVLLQTGWSRFWGKPEYLQAFPVMSEDAAGYLSGFSLKGVGIDAISMDGYDSTTLPVHRILLREEMIIIENLTALESLPEGLFKFYCFPLHFPDADGSPVRAIAEF